MKPAMGMLVGAALAALPHAAAQAAENFNLRYNVAGTVGGEMFAPDVSGFVGRAVFTNADIHEITGPGGGALARPLPGGVVALPPPTPSALYPGYGPSQARLDYTAHARSLNLSIVYLTHATYAGGRMAFGLALPYSVKRQASTLSGATPVLAFSPLVPAASQPAVSQQFSASFQSQLAAAGAAASGEVDGMGDMEVSAGWRTTAQRYRLTANLALSLPTGKYGALPGVNIGLGNFYTLRPEVAGTWFATESLGLAGKVFAGFNTTNRDNQWRSGHWAGAEFAAGWRFAGGVAGVQSTHLRQLADDKGTVYGANRLRADNAGAFVTFVIPGIGAGLTAQYMKTISSRNSIAGSYVQLRLTKVFGG